MGERYQLVRLGNAYYIEYSNDSTNWDVQVIQITAKQMQLIETLRRKRDEEMETLLKSMTIISG